MKERFGPYTLTASIAVGSLAEVFEAVDAAGAACAVKRLHPAMAKIPAQVALLEAEGRLGQSVRHPGLVRCLEAGRAPDPDGSERPYLCFELVRGTMLAEPSGPAPDPVDLACQLAGALGHLHDRGVVHNDVNPRNVLVESGGGLRLIDLGIASAIGEAQDQVRGTYAYMSPEQVRGQPLTAASDLFALATVVWEQYAGRPLFRRSAQYLTLAAVVEDDAPGCGAPAAIEAALAACLSKDPAARPQSAAELVEALSG